jgi:hypothetical protein
MKFLPTEVRLAVGANFYIPEIWGRQNVVKRERMEDRRWRIEKKSVKAI